MSYRAHFLLCIQEAERCGFHRYAEALREVMRKWEGDK